MQLIEMAPVFTYGHQVQCSGWCYSEAEADTGKNVPNRNELDLMGFSPSVQLCVDH